MVQETAATETQEATPTENTFREAAEAATPEPQPEPVEAEGHEEPTGPREWGDLEKLEWFSDALTEKRESFVEEAKPDILREAKREAYREFDPHIQRQEATLKEIANNGQKMLRAIRNIATDGGLEPRQFQNALQEVIDDNPGFVETLNSSMFNSGMDSGLKKLADEAGDPNLLSDMYIRLRNDPNMSDRAFAREYLDRLTESRMGDKVKEAVTKAKKPLEDEIASLKAKLNSKAATVETGPADLGGSPGGGKTYATMTPEERSKLTPEQRDALSAKVT